MSRSIKCLLVMSGVSLVGMAVIQAKGEVAVAAPRLGINAVIVDLNPRTGVPAPQGVASRGLKINRVDRGTPGAQLGLQPGDVIVSVDSMRFTTYEGFQHALTCAGQRPSFIIIDVNTGRLVRRATNLPHQSPNVCEPMKPDSYWMSIDLRSDM